MKEIPLLHSALAPPQGEGQATEGGGGGEREAEDKLSVNPRRGERVQGGTEMYWVCVKSKTRRIEGGKQEWTDDRGETGERERERERGGGGWMEQRREGARFCAYLA